MKLITPVGTLMPASIAKCYRWIILEHFINAYENIRI